MNAVNLIVEGYKKIFSGPNAVLKNVMLFCLTGIIALVSLYFENIKESKILFSELNPFTFVLAAILIIVAGIYIGGYTYSFINRSFYDCEDNILPDFNLKHISIFFKALPLAIIWIIYLTLVLILSGIFMSLIHILGIVLAIGFILMAVFTTFVFIAFCKNFDAKGLFDITLPFKFMSKTIGIVIILGLLFIVVGILSLVPSCLAGIVCGILGFGKSQFAYYLGGILGGYFGCLAQFVWYYCLVQVYKDNFLTDEL